MNMLVSSSLFFTYILTYSMSKNCILTLVDLMIEHHENETEFVCICDSMPRGITHCIDACCRLYQQRDNRFPGCNPDTSRCSSHAGRCSHCSNNDSSSDNCSTDRKAFRFLVRQQSCPLHRLQPMPMRNYTRKQTSRYPVADRVSVSQQSVQKPLILV